MNGSFQLNKNKSQINGKIFILWIGRLDIVKMSMIPKVTGRVNAISTKISINFLFEKKIHPTIHKESQGTPDFQNNLEKEVQS